MAFNNVAQTTSMDQYAHLFSNPGQERGQGTIQDYRRIKTTLAYSYGTGTITGAPGNSAVYGKKERQIERNSITLERIFQSEIAVRIFYAFASFRLVHEGILFWEDVEAFQNGDWKAALILGLDNKRCEKRTPGTKIERKKSGSRSESQIMLEAQRIYNKYLADDAEYEVCIPSAMKEGLYSSLQSGRFDIGVFREAQRYVFRDMEKSLFREFLSSLNSRGLRVLNDAICETRLTAAHGTVNALCAVDSRTISSEEKDGRCD